jgi:hypothetical protein
MCVNFPSTISASFLKPGGWDCKANSGRRNSGGWFLREKDQIVNENSAQPEAWDCALFFLTECLLGTD